MSGFVEYNRIHREGEQYHTYTATTKPGNPLGTILDLGDRKFVLVGAGAAALAAGKLHQAPSSDTTYDDLAMAAAAAGATSVTVTLSGNAATLNQFADGYLVISDDAGEGHIYKIKSNPAADDSATCVITLYPETPLKVACTAATTVTVLRDLYDNCIVHPSPPTSKLLGVAAVEIPIDGYGWLQFAGPAAVLIDGTVVQGKRVMASDGTDGSVEDYVLAEGTPNTLANAQVVGTVFEVGATTEYGGVWLEIPGIG